MKSRLVIIQCAGCIFWQILSRRFKRSHKHGGFMQNLQKNHVLLVEKNLQCHTSWSLINHCVHFLNISFEQVIALQYVFSMLTIIIITSSAVFRNNILLMWWSRVCNIDAVIMTMLLSWRSCYHDDAAIITKLLSWRWWYFVIWWW